MLSILIALPVLFPKSRRSVKTTNSTTSSKLSSESTKYLDLLQWINQSPCSDALARPQKKAYSDGSSVNILQLRDKSLAIERPTHP